jgi:hypothetical protein
LLPDPFWSAYWPSDVVAGLEMLIKRNKTSIIDDFKIQRTLPHGHVVATLGTLKRIGLEKIIASKPSLSRNIIEALIVQRVLNPGSKLAAKRGFDMGRFTCLLTHAPCDYERGVGELRDRIEYVHRTIQFRK